MFAYWWLVFAPLTFYTVVSLTRGTRLAGGFHKLCASIGMRVRGRRTPATATTGECSSPSTRGLLSGDALGPTLQRHVSNFGAPGLSIYVMADLGVSGELPVSAGSDE